MLIARRNMMCDSAQDIPYPLTDWIESRDWHSSIKIHTLTKNSQVGFRIKWISSGTVRTSALFGCSYDGIVMQYLPLYNNSSGGILDYPSSSYRRRPSFAVEGEIDDLFLGNRLIRNGIEIATSQSGSLSAGSNLFVLSRALNDSVFYGEKIKQVEIYEDGELVSNNIAVQANGQGAMYDIIGRVLKENAYSGGFLDYQLKTT